MDIYILLLSSSGRYIPSGYIFTYTTRAQRDPDPDPRGFLDPESHPEVGI
jgi:hypothetical protein